MSLMRPAPALKLGSACNGPFERTGRKPKIASWDEVPNEAGIPSSGSSGGERKRAPARVSSPGFSLHPSRQTRLVRTCFGAAHV